VEGVSLAYAALAGPDPADATSLPEPRDAPAERVRGMRIGVLAPTADAAPADDVATGLDAALRALEKAGAHLADVELPHARHALAAYYVIASAEASSNLARYDGVRYGDRVAGDTLEELYVGTRTRGFGAEVRRRILLGTFALSAGYADEYYGRATRVRERLRTDYARAFASVDAIVSPVAATSAFRLGERTADPLAMYRTDALTIPASLAGLPAASVPVPGAGRLPVGVHVQAPFGADERVLRVAAALERELGSAAPPPEPEGGA